MSSSYSSNQKVSLVYVVISLDQTSDRKVQWFNLIVAQLSSHLCVSHNAWSSWNRRSFLKNSSKDTYLEVQKVITSTILSKPMTIWMDLRIDFSTVKAYSPGYLPSSPSVVPYHFPLLYLSPPSFSWVLLQSDQTCSNSDRSILIYIISRFVACFQEKIRDHWRVLHLPWTQAATTSYQLYFTINISQSNQ